MTPVVARRAVGAWAPCSGSPNKQAMMFLCMVFRCRRYEQIYADKGRPNLLESA